MSILMTESVCEQHGYVAPTCSISQLCLRVVDINARFSSEIH